MNESSDTCLVGLIQVIAILSADNSYIQQFRQWLTFSAMLHAPVLKLGVPLKR